jgi:two-component sensor histidine kinase
MKLPRSLPIRTHLLIFGLLVLVPTLFIAGLITIRFAQSTRAFIEEKARDRALDVAVIVDHRLAQMITALRALATSPSVDEGDFAAFYDQAKQVLPSGDYVIAMRDATGQQIVNTFVPWGTPLPVSVDATLLRADNRVFDTKQPVVSDLYVGAVSRRPFLLVDVPVIRNGQVRYALNMAMQPETLRGWLPEVDEGWLFAITDSEHLIIARSRDHEKFVGRRAAVEFTKQLTESSGTMVSRTLDGADVFTAYKKLGLAGWTIIVSVPIATLAEPVRQLWLTLAGLIVTAALASILAALAYSRLLGRELHALSAEAAAVAAENPVSLKTSSIREVDEVHQAIADAAVDLAEGRAQQKVLLAELNHRVKNTLAIIQTLIGRTVTDQERPEAARATLRGRVAALATAHDALSDAEWRDADLEALVNRLIAARGRQISVSGPPVLLRPKALVSIAQSLQELLNHSLGKGALARGGTVEIRWDLDERALTLVWADKALHAPLLEEPDFGATIIRLCIERQLGGTYGASAQDGWRYTLSIPFATELGVNLQPGMITRQDASL